MLVDAFRVELISALIMLIKFNEKETKEEEEEENKKSGKREKRLCW